MSPNQFRSTDRTCTAKRKDGQPCRFFRMQGMETCCKHTPKEFRVDVSDFKTLDILEAIKTLSMTIRKLVRGELPDNQAYLTWAMMETTLEMARVHRAILKDKQETYLKAKHTTLKILEKEAAGVVDRNRRKIIQQIK